MTDFTDEQVEVKRQDLMYGKKIFGGIPGIAKAIGRAIATVAGWCSHPERNCMPYDDCLLWSAFTGRNISGLTPNKIEANKLVNAYRLSLPVPVLQIVPTYILKRTLPYLSYESDGRVIVDADYFLISGLMKVKQKIKECIELKDKKISVIRLDLSLLLLGIRNLDDFSDFFSDDERFNIGTCFDQQWKALQKRCAMELKRNPELLQIKSKLGADWDPFSGEKSKKIAEIVGLAF